MVREGRPGAHLGPVLSEEHGVPRGPVPDALRDECLERRGRIEDVNGPGAQGRVLSQGAEWPDIVEDELILALPLVPMHDEATCQVPRSYATGGDEKGVEEHHPFAQLAELKKNPPE